MKKRFYYSIFLVLTIAALAVSCEFDNYDEPEATLQGNLVYNGTPIQVPHNDVRMELWEPGWELKAPITVAVSQDGSYSAKLFEGSYKLVIPSGEGPFMSNSDTIELNVSGTTQKDIEVTPYYMITGTPNFTVVGDSVRATFGLTQVITDANAESIENVHLYLNRTQFVDEGTALSTGSQAGASISDIGNITLTTELPDLVMDQDYIFARVGVKITNRDDMLCSAITKLQQ